MDAGLLVIRVVFGAMMAAHGSQKLFGWFGGYGLAGTGGFFEQLGYRPGRLFAALAGATETSGGLLFAIGFLQPLAAMAIISVMIVAIGTAHWGHGLFAMTNGVEVPLLYSTAAAAVAVTGPGAYSADAIFGLAPYWTPLVGLLAIAAAMLVAAANLRLRRPVPQPAVSGT